MSTPARTEPVHVVALTGCRTKKAKILYACDHIPGPSTSDVLAWLVRYGVVTDPGRERSHVSTVVNEYRRERGLSDTGSTPAMTPEMTAEMDRLRAEHEHPNTPANTGLNTPNTPAQHPNTAPNAPANTSNSAGQKVNTVGQHPNTIPNTAPNTPAASGHRSPPGATGFYLAAVLALGVSVDTSWRFFGSVLGITSLVERSVMFAVLEVALVACGVAMRAAVQRTGRPGPARLTAWSLCGLSGYMAFVLSGPADGLARVALGPVLSMVMLHLALGIEVRARHGQRATSLARVASELRERALSRLGLSDDQRDALTRTRDRAARSAAKLAGARLVMLRGPRLARCLRLSNVAHDPAARARLLAELATVQHAGKLASLPLPSPWVTVHEHPNTDPNTPNTPAQHPNTDPNAPNTGHEQPA